MGWLKAVNNYIHSSICGLIFLCLPTHNIYKYTWSNHETLEWPWGQDTEGFSYGSHCLFILHTGHVWWNLWIGFGWILVVILLEFDSRIHHIVWCYEQVKMFEVLLLEYALLLQYVTSISNKELLRSYCFRFIEKLRRERNLPCTSTHFPLNIPATNIPTRVVLLLQMQRWTYTHIAVSAKARSSHYGHSWCTIFRFGQIDIVSSTILS